MSIDDLVFLESFELAQGAARDVAYLVFVGDPALRVLGLDHGSRLAVDEVDFVSVNDAVVLALNSEVVGDEFNGSLGRSCHS